MRAVDLRHVEAPGELTVSPDGRSVIYDLATIDVDDDRYVQRLWRVPADGSGSPVRLTHGRADNTPRFSPDGRWLAFRRAGDDTPAQLYVLPVDGGEPRAVTTKEQHPLGAGQPVWSPDSTRLAYCARVPEAGRYGTDEKVTAGREPPRRITHLDYRRDGVGYTLDRPAAVFVVDPFAEPAEPTAAEADDAAATDPTPNSAAATAGTAVSSDPATPDPAAPVRVTGLELDAKDVAWSPDGTLLAFAAIHPDSRGRNSESSIWVVEPTGGAPRRISAQGHHCQQPVFAPDGASVRFAAVPTGPDGRDWFARNAGVHSVPLGGSSAQVQVSDQARHNLGGYFGPGHHGVLFSNENRGAVELLEFDAPGREPEVILGGCRQVRTAAIGGPDSGDLLAAVVASPSSFGEVVVVDGAGERVLTDYGQRFADRCRIRPMEEITATAPDGYPVHGWVVRPDGDGPHPVLLMIHGGPFAQYGWMLFDEAQVYAEAGYAVVYGNPRGSSGYGQEHGRYIVGDVGERSAPDVLALLDHALKDPTLDGDRIGVLGGSHGGYMTSWLIGQSDRFRAAVSERAVNAIDSFMGTSDVGWLFDGLYGTDPAARHRQSPLSRAAEISTPLLIIHSEQDHRCPLEQAQRLFAALADRGAVVELLVFPGEGHELSRTGLPSHRRARLDAVVDWFDRHLSG